MGKNKTYRIFISHSWTYKHHYYDLLHLLRNCQSHPDVEIIDYSVPEHDPIHDADNVRDLCNAIKNQMAPAQVVIMLGGMYSTYSKWINKEIALAKCKFQKPKPVLLVRPRGKERLSCPVQCAADEEVGWNCRSILEAIERLTVLSSINFIKDCDFVKDCIKKDCKEYMEKCPL